MKKRNKTLMILIIALAVLVLVFGCNRAKDQENEQPQTAAQTEQTVAAEEQTAQTQATTTTQTAAATQAPAADYTFRNKDLLKSHYKKHGRYMGFDSAEEYLAAANAVIANPQALTKTEKEDGDYLYYVEDTNEFVVLSTDGYIRTYFCPDSGKRYFDKQ